MVAHQIKNFLNDGSIINSVNFPTSQLERSSDHRITIINKNIPSAISQITAILAEDKLNISEMVNKSRDEIAYNIIDLDSEVATETIEKILALDGIIRVRKLAPKNS